MSLRSFSAFHVAVLKTAVWGLPLIGMVGILAWSSSAWSLHMTLTADDQSSAVLDQGLVLTVDSGGEMRAKVLHQERPGQWHGKYGCD